MNVQNNKKCIAQVVVSAAAISYMFYKMTYRYRINKHQEESASSPLTVGILHPGMMGQSLAAAIRNNVKVLWASDGRSMQTRARAKITGLVDVKDINTIAKQSSLIISICPPSAAEDVAKKVANTGFQGIYLEANAINPQKSSALCTLIESVGAKYIDGCVIGPAKRKKNSTYLYLSGPHAKLVLKYFKSHNENNTLPKVIVLDEKIGTASSLKMCFASWTKGSNALAAAVEALALREGVHHHLMEIFQIKKSDFLTRSQALPKTVLKAWRFIGEMDEMINTYAANKVPTGFHQGAKNMYQMLSCFKDCNVSVSEIRHHLAAATTITTTTTTTINDK